MQRYEKVFISPNIFLENYLHTYIFVSNKFIVRLLNDVGLPFEPTSTYIILLRQGGLLAKNGLSI